MEGKWKGFDGWRHFPRVKDPDLSVKFKIQGGGNFPTRLDQIELKILFEIEGQVYLTSEQVFIGRG